MAVSNPSRAKTITVIVAVIFVAGIVAYVVRSSQEVVNVHTARVSYQDLASTESTTGTVEPMESFLAHATAPGMVEKIYVKVGQQVAAGTLLLRMNDSDAYARLASSNAALATQKAAEEAIQHGGVQDELNGFQNDLTRAELTKKQAVKNLAVLQALQQKGDVSAGEVADAQQRVANAQAQIDSIHQRMSNRYSPAEIKRSQAAVAEAEAAVAAANQAVSQSDIRSKVAGTVYAIRVTEFEYVGGGDELVDVANLEKMRVRAYFDEPSVGKLAAGQPVTITWDSKPGQTWHGHIAIPPTNIQHYTTRNVGESLVAVDDAKGDLLPNSNVTVKVTTSQRPHVLSIPHDALHTEGARTYVYTIQNGRLVQTTVQVGALVNVTRVEIAGGLSENQQVVLNATDNQDLTSGLKVKATE